MPRSLFVLAVAVSGFVAVSPAIADRNEVTWTGWLSDRQCAMPRVSRGVIAPNNPDCVRKCLKTGTPLVFISEDAKDAFDVVNYTRVDGDLDYRLEMTGVVDRKAGILSVSSVKRLEPVSLTCSLPRKRS